MEIRGASHEWQWQGSTNSLRPIKSHSGNVFNSTNFRQLAYQLQQVNTLPSPVLSLQPCVPRGTHTTAGFEFERVRYIESLG